MRLVLQDIYAQPHEGRAREAFLNWCHWVRDASLHAPHILFAPMVAAAKMILGHLKGIMAHWGHRITNAYMEALNSVFSATKRKARDHALLANRPLPRRRKTQTAIPLKTARSPRLSRRAWSNATNTPIRIGNDSRCRGFCQAKGEGSDPAQFSTQFARLAAGSRRSVPPHEGHYFNHTAGERSA